MSWFNNLINKFHYKHREIKVNPQMSIDYAARNPVSWSVGRLNSMLMNTIVFGRPWLSFGGSGNPETEIGQAMIDAISTSYGNVSFPGDTSHVQVYLNHNNLFKELRRLVQPNRRVNLLQRLVVGVPTTVLGWLSAQLSSSSFYNPYTESVTVMARHEAFLRHEIGHAEYFANQSYPGLRSLMYTLPVVRGKMELDASSYAMKRTPLNARARMSRILNPAFGTYFFADLMQFGLPVASMLFPAAVVPAGLLFASSVAAGHISAARGGGADQTMFDPNI